MSSTSIAIKKNTTPRKMLLTADDYQRMGAAGIFDDKPRVELIEGEIFTMSPITPDHNGHVAKIAEFFTIKLYKKARIWNQGSIRINEHSEPEPDIAILRYEESFYTDRAVNPSDVFLVIEVAVFSLKGDRTIKKKLYAKAGIPEYWIVIPEQGIIEVYRKPSKGIYTEKSTYKKEDSWMFETFELEVSGSDLLV